MIEEMDQLNLHHHLTDKLISNHNLSVELNFMELFFDIVVGQIKISVLILYFSLVIG